MIEHSWKLTISAPCSTARRVRSRIRERLYALSLLRCSNCAAATRMSHVTSSGSPNSPPKMHWSIKSLRTELARLVVHADCAWGSRKRRDTSTAQRQRRTDEGPGDKGIATDGEAGKAMRCRCRTAHRSPRDRTCTTVAQPLRPGGVEALDHRAGCRQTAVDDEWVHEHEQAADDQAGNDEQAAADREGNAEAGPNPGPGRTRRR